MVNNMYFERKVYKKLIDWKNNYSNKYAIMLEGARRVGKSTIAKNFAQNEYRSYIMLDFSNVSKKFLIYLMIFRIWICSLEDYNLKQELLYLLKNHLLFLMRFNYFLRQGKL